MRSLNKWLIIFIVIGFISALLITYQRHQIESANNTVEIAVDYDEAADIARQEGITPSDFLRQLKEQGITSVAVYEANLERLARTGDVTVLQGATILNQYKLGGLNDRVLRQLTESGEILPEDVYVIAPPLGFA